MYALEGEMISSALFANGVRIFGHHPVGNAPQGIYCVNGQCSQCTVLVDSIPVKACMTAVKPEMRITSCEGIPELPAEDLRPEFTGIETIDTEVLVVGAGPAGINTAVELGELGIETLLIDDKEEPGGKLTLQTHPFFGSREDCYAGIRGIRIADILTEKLESLDKVTFMGSTSAVGVFHDRAVGLYSRGRYLLVKPNAAVVATGAREKSLAFPGCDLPGVYGAGAFQTLLNRDLIRPSERLFIVGGGNVGLIAGYHALQAGIKTVGLVEALDKCGGYKVHLDKLRELGVPIFTSHTVIRAEGKETVEKVVISEIDREFRPVAGTRRGFDVDTLLIAVGLSPINELYQKFSEFGIQAFTCGDSSEISEASAAIFSGKITGRKVARELGYDVEIPSQWEETEGVLRSDPGKVYDFKMEEAGLDKFPVIRCVQEIPCNPCVDSCPRGSIVIEDDTIMGLPHFEGECIGCMKCVTACPALAVTLVLPSEKKKRSNVVIPFELKHDFISRDKEVTTVDMDAEVVGEGKIIDFREAPGDSKRLLVTLEVPEQDARRVAGIRVFEPEEGYPVEDNEEVLDDETIICRCERVTAGRVRKEILNGVRDMNILKGTVRTGMGACGGKTCTDLILRLFRECGVNPEEITLPTDRPFIEEIPLSVFAGIGKGDGNARK
ncbi:MAG: sulfurtransferase [Candidatus Latescibacteria bacterium]|nr:sulfurtransferase [bacterium]MBD3423287.1 sulfurtransferase [Candidatus Latescibacterota bacterium]